MACTDKIASRRPIIATFWGGLSLILSCAAIVPKIHAQPPAPITPEAVLKSMERGVAWLKQEQQADGNWPDRPGYAQGLTPLCTLALLHAGCDAKDPAVAKALTVLRGLEPQATYTTSLQTMVFCLADPKEFHDLIVRNVKWLESRQHKFGPRTGMWATSDPGSPDHTDNSMTHLAMLALYEAERVGVPAGDMTWRLALGYWQSAQNPDGSWGWGPGYSGTGSMTCGGIAAIKIAQGRLGIGDAAVRENAVNCCGKSLVNDHLDKAVDWMGKHFSVVHNPGSEFWLSYYMYSLERAGRLTGNRFFGGHDWFREGVKMLVETQFLSGGWPSDIDNEYAGDPNVSTAFSLMFLAKGRRPIVFAHLRHGTGGDWNRHRAAASNLVTRTEQAWDRELAHQTVDLAAATVEDLLESPVLLITGRDKPSWNNEQKQKLRAYVDRGGFIFAVQNCDDGKFEAGFRDFIRELFPESGGGLRLLPVEHPVWRAEAPIDPKYLGELWGLDTACRTSVVYSPRDLTCFWDLAGVGRESGYLPEIQQEIAAAVTTGVNVLAYATNRELKFKDPASPAVFAAHPIEEFARGKLYVANVLHTGGCAAAPASLRNLLRVAADKYKLPCDTEPRQVRLTEESLFQYHLISLHGTSRFTLTPAERDQLRLFLKNGGMVFADAVCSSKAFTDSFRAEMQLVLPDHALEAISSDDPLLSPMYGGHDLRDVERRVNRKSDQGAATSVEILHGPPRLEGIQLDDRYAVVFSPDDLSCALNGPEPAGCEGYSRLDAARLAMNVLLYSLHR